MELVIVTIAIVAAICAAIYLLDEIIWVFTSPVKVIVLTLKAAVKAVGRLQSRVRQTRLETGSIWMEMMVFLPNSLWR